MSQARAGLRLLLTLVIGAGLWAMSGTAFGQTSTPPPRETTPEPTPTIDRLAAPPTVANPTQPDEGAQLFWLHCQPCHGDQGQGLTDEWRAQYPEEDRDCWNSGCHGKRPYEEGFILPTTVPPVIGAGSLVRFETAGDLYDYIRATMPYEYPGTLLDEEYLAITAFLMRSHGAWAGGALNATNVRDTRLKPGVAPIATPSPGPTSQAGPGTRWPASLVLVGVVFLALLVGAGGMWLWRRRI